MSLHRHAAPLGVLALAALLAAAHAARAAPRTLDDYRHFRALSVDLNGRIPTRAELAAFEQESFSLPAWVDARLGSAPYADRLARIYLDLLRLQVGSSFQFVPGPTTLRRNLVLGPDGQSWIGVYYRANQRRARQETDGAFCLTQAETGLQFPSANQPIGTPIATTQAILDQSTVLVSPWWLYADYQAAAPADRYGPSWADAHPGFVPAPALLTEAPDGGTGGTLDGGYAPVAQVRVCKEEAQAPAAGTIYAHGRPNVNRTLPPPFGRLTYPPDDSAYAKAHRGEPVDCATNTAYGLSADCGCGPGLERCLPSPGVGFETAALTFQGADPLGTDAPVDVANQPLSSWNRLWWGEEAARFLQRLFAEDRDFREVLTGRWSVVNGPLAQFYRAVAPATCCSGAALGFNLTRSEPLFDPAALPAGLPPHAANDWRVVADRGPRASGVLTMPVFLTKFGSRRARAHVLYSAFLCRDFVAPNLQLRPSTEPNLMKREGCSACHTRLEPLAAYFARVSESDWTWLPPDKLPARNALCKGKADGGAPGGNCTTFYDPAFQDADAGTLRGAYGSPENADQGPAGMAQELAGSPEFAGCVAENLAAALLGRRLTRDDGALKAKLTDAFVASGYKVRPLVRELVLSPEYLHSNNLSSGAWRDGGR